MNPVEELLEPNRRLAERHQPGQDYGVDTGHVDLVERRSPLRPERSAGAPADR